ncbi:hypothetical protein CBM2623_B170420 [Cupriavidus taiwanensis]|nr:hypothetical protein CBM2608_B140488 [Cupriavidus taiwanensis]SPA33376.1 hypothetical protein CBM2623_B170420 [Cupriavidus taiwanensis]
MTMRGTGAWDASRSGTNSTASRSSATPSRWRPAGSGPACGAAAAKDMRPNKDGSSMGVSGGRLGGRTNMVIFCILHTNTVRR